MARDEAIDVLKCITKHVDHECDEKNCPWKKHMGLCLMIMSAIATYKDWRGYVT